MILRDIIEGSDLVNKNEQFFEVGRELVFIL